jgi:hypothetical protein
MNYPMQSSGLAGLNTVQNMSDQNMSETLMANGGQRFSRGGISNIQRMAAGGIPKYTYDSVTGKYTLADDTISALSSDSVPKYTYDPITQRFTLDTSTDKKKEDVADSDSSAGGGSDPYVDPNPNWSNMTLDQKAAYFADNPKEAKVASTLAGLVKDFSVLGRVASYFDPIGVGERMASLRGVGLGPDGRMAQNNMVAEVNSRLGIDIPDPGGLRGSLSDPPSLGDQPGDYDGQGTSSQTGVGNPGESTPGAGGISDPSDTGYGVFAQGGLSALARGGISNLGDYSDGGRLLRGPGDGVSDSIPATIANKQPARLADGEFVVPARIVSELGNGSTEAGARKLYQMLARVQNARKKSIGQGRVAVNSRADKMLPA